MLINVYVASPDPDPNHRGGGQLPNTKECNSTLTSETNIYPYNYIDVNDRGHLTNYPHSPPPLDRVVLLKLPNSEVTKSHPKGDNDTKFSIDRFHK